MLDAMLRCAYIQIVRQDRIEDTEMARSQPHAIIRNGRDVVAVFPSQIQAEEAYYDLGCYLDEKPSPTDVFEVKSVDGLPS
jgi:hypothetical protein